jgi:hypothetical protein
MNFILFKNAVAAQFKKMQHHQLYVTKPEAVNGQTESVKEALYERYQSAFPKGTNEVFRERPQHDCNCCKSFIRTVGNVVAIIDGKVETIWDIEIPEEPTYQIVAHKMASLVRKWKIEDKFLHYLPHAGTDYSLEEIDGNSHKWDHFYADIDNKFVMPEAEIGTFLSEKRGIRDVFIRGMQTIELDAIDTVVDLLAQGSLYRGDEKESNLLRYREAVAAYDAIEYQEDAVLWALTEVEKLHPAVAKMRNTSMGTLLVALSEGEDLETAVKAYEKKVAPENYQRSSAVVTKAMKDKAQKFVEEHGLESALHRRHAKPTDITVVNTLFANRKAKSLMAGSVFDEVVTKTKQKFDFIEEVEIEHFLTKVMPKAESLELYIENSHFGNLVSLTAPIYPDAKPILKWDNNFAWSYRGEVTDSIKEKVKAAGGVVDADLCCRLAWNNFDDLDLHMIEPNGNEIYFRDRESYTTGGMLDVDMNAGRGTTRSPVENIFYKSKSKMKEGVYKLVVNQWASRETSDIGFEVNIDFMGQIWKFTYDKRMRSGDDVTVARFKYSHAKGVEILDSLPYTEKSVTEWGITSQEWAPVNMVMLSPNHWDDNKAGNKHWFFILDKCSNPEPVRGFYNEFLKPEFWEHRKVFEVLAGKIKAPFAEEQMSGLGFSSTQRNHILCRVSGAFNRVIKIVF